MNIALKYAIEQRLWTRQSILRYPGEIEEGLLIFHSQLFRCPSLSCPLDSLPPPPPPPGVKPTAVGFPPGGKLSRDILPPTLVIFTPGGQAVPGYLAPDPGYLHPRGASCPGRFILPPPNTSKNIYMLFCYFSVSF